ncbi:MAG: JDVT-CTERM system glutamic-type intramembrane protease [Granulosicoccus sp.]
MKSPATDLVFWTEWPFWLALSLGPMCWIVMFQLGIPLRGGNAPWETLLWVALLYPVLEEIVFRGGLQTALFSRAVLRRSLMEISLANIVTSVIFAAMHTINQPPLWAALVFFPSLVFGWARDRYLGIQASIVLHIVYNAGFVWLFSG